MSDEFDLLELAHREGGPEAVFEHLVRTAREQNRPRDLFAVRVMQVRHRLGLPLIETEKVDLEGEQRQVYETAFRDAARETGELFLAGGDVAGAWPYFKAIGEQEPVAAAIENVTGGENLDRVIEIAFREGVNPRKGFELLLEHHGICSAITWYGSSPDYTGRPECLRLLVRTLYNQLAASLRETVAATESVTPPNSVGELIAGRDWLFEGMSSYVDSTHLVSILRFAPDLEDARAIAHGFGDGGVRMPALPHVSLPRRPAVRGCLSGSCGVLEGAARRWMAMPPSSTSARNSTRPERLLRRS